MHIAVIFINIGNYHIARLQAAARVCRERGWQLTAIQVTDDQLDHPWGSFAEQPSFPIKTLMSIASEKNGVRFNATSSIANTSLKQCLQHLQPDIVFLPGWSSPVVLAGLRWCQSTKTLPILMSDSQESDAPRIWWRELVKSWRVRRYKAALVGGKSHQRYLVKLGMPAEAIFYGYDIVDNDYFHPARLRNLSRPLASPYFLSINRFVAKKNLLFLLRAYAKYRQSLESQPWDLVLCGDGELRSQIEQQITELGLSDCVHLPGFLQQQDLLPYLTHAKCLVHASVQEQWGLVVNEAMAAGLPILVSNRCGCAEELVIDGVNGFSFDPTNQQELTQLMVRLNSDTVDLNAMSQASLEQIQKFSPDYFADSLVKAVEYALAYR